MLQGKLTCHVFHLKKLLVPSVQIGLQMYLNEPDLFLNGSGFTRKTRHCRCQSETVSLPIESQPLRVPRIDESMDSGKVVSCPTVRSEIRTFNMQGEQQNYECNNPFQFRVPNRLIVAMVASTTFNGEVTQDRFCFQKFDLSSIKQLLRGEEYPRRPWK